MNTAMKREIYEAIFGMPPQNVLSLPELKHYWEKGFKGSNGKEVGYWRAQKCSGMRS